MKLIFKDFQIHIFSFCVKNIDITNYFYKNMFHLEVLFCMSRYLYAQFSDFNTHIDKKISAIITLSILN